MLKDWFKVYLQQPRPPPPDGSSGSSSSSIYKRKSHFSWLSWHGRKPARGGSVLVSHRHRRPSLSSDQSKTFRYTPRPNRTSSKAALLVAAPFPPPPCPDAALFLSSSNSSASIQLLQSSRAEAKRGVLPRASARAFTTPNDDGRLLLLEGVRRASSRALPLLLMCRASEAVAGRNADTVGPLLAAKTAVNKTWKQNAFIWRGSRTKYI